MTVINLNKQGETSKIYYLFELSIYTLLVQIFPSNQAHKTVISLLHPIKTTIPNQSHASIHKYIKVNWLLHNIYFWVRLLRFAKRSEVVRFGPLSQNRSSNN